MSLIMDFELYVDGRTFRCYVCKGIFVQKIEMWQIEEKLVLFFLPNQQKSRDTVPTYHFDLFFDNYKNYFCGLTVVIAYIYLHWVRENNVFLDVFFCRYLAIP